MYRFYNDFDTFMVSAQLLVAVVWGAEAALVQGRGSRHLRP